MSTKNSTFKSMKNEISKTGLIFDLGSSNAICGFGGSCAPRTVFPTKIAGKEKRKLAQFYKTIDTGKFIEEDDGYLESLFEIENIIQHGNVKNWDKYIKLLEKIEKQDLRTNINQFACLISESPNTAVGQTKKKAEIFFEHFDVKEFSVELDTTLCLYSSGRTIGTVLSSGGGVTSVVCYESKSNFSTNGTRIDFGGDKITDYLSKILYERGYQEERFSNSLIQKMKEKICYTSFDFDADMKSIHESTELDKTYECPDGSLLTFGSERFRPFEIMFQPSMVQNEIPSFPHLIRDSILKCEDEYQTDLFSNICVFGGNTLSQGFSERLDKEMKLYKPEQKVKIIAPPERRYSTWIGGSIIACSSLMDKKIISKEDYEEHGSSIVQQKQIQ